MEKDSSNKEFFKDVGLKIAAEVIKSPGVKGIAKGAIVGTAYTCGFAINKAGKKVYSIYKKKNYNKKTTR